VVNEYIFEGSQQAIFPQASFLKTAQQNNDLQPENKDRQRTMGLCVNQIFGLLYIFIQPTAA